MDDLFSFMDSVGSWFTDTISGLTDFGGELVDAVSSGAQQAVSYVTGVEPAAVEQAPSAVTEAAGQAAQETTLPFQSAPEPEWTPGFDVPSQDAKGMIAAQQGARGWMSGESLPSGQMPEWKGLPDPVQEKGMLSNVADWVKTNPKLAEFIAKTVGGVASGNSAMDLEKLRAQNQMAVLDKQQQQRMEYEQWRRNNLNGSVKNRLAAGGPQGALTNIRGEEIHNGLIARLARGG